MPSQILPTASTPADSADIVVASGALLTVALKGQDTEARVTVSIKDDGGAYQPIAQIDRTRNPVVVSAPGTYRFSRTAGTCGVFSA